METRTGDRDKEIKGDKGDRTGNVFPPCEQLLLLKESRFDSLSCQQKLVSISRMVKGYEASNI